MKNMHGKNFRKAAAVMGLIGLLTCLSGCGKMPDGKDGNLASGHEVSDVTAISLVCGHMDYRFSYSFAVTRDETGEDGLWLFNAQCFTKDHEQETMFDGRPLSKENVETLLGILEKYGTADFAERYIVPEESPLQAMDETMYSFSLVFSDGSRYLTDSAGKAQEELEAFFYRLAEEKEAL